ncbi:hypothetical protein EG68_11717 [Paragonimus skrjabini miyazakii]|uniref:RNA helicase n=1 Tax=Paragonimus skrjabini miyazakii TaxID=59628 RepID=A0A8S9YE54_9TREM|nr:hypothetical protein EG68_11717 [Paragonimus skrjabini miyazakii]
MMKITVDDPAETDIHLSEDVTSYPTFASMGIRLELLKGIYKYGFDKPSVIQQKSIRQIIDGRDVIAQAQSGTGKTATFSIGIGTCAYARTCQPNPSGNVGSVRLPPHSLCGVLRWPQQRGRNVS